MGTAIRGLKGEIKEERRQKPPFVSLGVSDGT